MINLSLLLAASFGFALLAEWAAQKWERVCFWLGSIAVLLLFLQEMGRGWLLPCTLLVCLLLEALWSRRWYHWASKETLTTLGMFSISILSLTVVLLLVVGGFMEELPPGTGSWGLASIGTPLWLQVLVLTVLVDFKEYWFHRGGHSFGFWWRFHKLHHRPSELHCIAGHVNHPTVYIGNLITSIGIAYLIGATTEAYAMHVLIYGTFVGYIAHLNLNVPRLDQKFPWFVYLIVTPNFHAWHHTFVCRYDANLAGMFPIWDVLFGTFEMPRGNPCDWQYGLQESEQLPPSVLGQIISPFGKVKKYAMFDFPKEKPNPIPFSD